MVHHSFNHVLVHLHLFTSSLLASNKSWTQILSYSSQAMEEENQSHPLQPNTEKRVGAVSSSLVPKTGNGSFVGRHRMAAAITHLQNQITLLQEELDQLDTLGESSIACKELVESVNNIPDPLIPLTRGPTNVGWDRWFRGTHYSRRRWI